MIKQIYMMYSRSTYNEFEYFMLYMFCKVITCIFVGVMTMYGVEIFGPWATDTGAIYFGWLAAGLTFGYWASRWCYFLKLEKSDRLNTRTGEVKRNPLLKSRHDKKVELLKLQIQQAQESVAFASKIK